MKETASLNKVLEVKELTKTYGGTAAVKDFSFSVTKGEIFGLLGHNGAGKTTTIECILNTKKPDTGEITLLGLRLPKNRKVIFQQVGVQMQESHYQDKIRVWECCMATQVLYSKPLDYQQLLKDFSLYEKRNSYVSELSGGQRQKLSVLLALIPDPKIIFLDELTTGLDPKARREIWNYLLQLKEKGKSILLTSHYMDEVEKLCDRICILKNGIPQITGTPAQVISASGTDSLEDAYLLFTGEEALHESF